MTIQSMKLRILAGLLLGAVGAFNSYAAGNSVVTFSVDMSAQITGGTFTPGVDTVAARGSFNGWGTLNLVQDGATTIYTNTVVDTADNGTKLEYKYWHNHLGGDNWENPANSQNRAALLPATSGGSLVLPTVFYADAGPDTPLDMTFQVDMAQQIVLGNFGGGQTVEVQGDFQGWVTGSTLNQMGAGTIYTNTFTVGGSPGRTVNFKYVIQPAGTYESVSSVNSDGTGNRYAAHVAGTVPVVYFADQPPAPIRTNDVLFQVDMSVQILSGAFNPASQTVCVNGGFNGWASGANTLSNNPSGPTPNIYTNIFQFIAGEGSTHQFKYVIFDGVNTTYETLSASTPQIGGNRYLTVINATSQTLPLAYFSDTFPGDFLTQATAVTFSVDMTGAVGTDAWVFNPASDTIYLNGDFASWWAWGGSGGGIQPNPLPAPPAQYQLIAVGTSSIYTNTFVLPAGTSVKLTYKYGINGFDDEAGFGNNHVRYVRALGSYALPQDTFASMTAEESFGNLKVGPPSGGNVPITWLGRPGVHLQTTSSLSSGSWTDLLGTDATSSTNYPVGGGAAFFRLIKPGL